jgi:hypothetical protein
MNAVHNAYDFDLWIPIPASSTRPPKNSQELVNSGQERDFRGQSTKRVLGGGLNGLRIVWIPRGLGVPAASARFVALRALAIT